MNESTNLKEKSRQAIITAVLWLLTVALAIASFFAGRRVLLSTYNRFFPGYLAADSRDGLSLMNILVSLPLAILVIAIVIGGFEFHFRKAGSQDSRWMFAYTLAVEAGFLLLALFL